MAAVLLLSKRPRTCTDSSTPRLRLYRHNEASGSAERTTQS